MADIKVFRNKIWNPTVWEKYMQTLPSTKELALIKGALFTNVNKYKAKMNEQNGGNWIIEPIKGRLSGTPVNYDGNTSAPDPKSRKTYYQGKVVFGRQEKFGEYDFTSDITSTNFKADASEVKTYWDEYKQRITLGILKGIFSMTGNNDFASKHTYEVSGNLEADSMNNASQKALGDKKAKLQVMYMHSAVATHLESLNQIKFLTQTDQNGMTRDLTIGTFNGKLVIVDDDMPVEDGYYSAKSTDEGALKVVADTATPAAGEIKLSDVKAKDFYPDGVKANDYVVEGKQYVTYAFENGFFEFEDIGATTPAEPKRDADNARTDLITRERWAIVPKYISFKQEAMASESPTDTELSSGTSWEVVHTKETNPEYVDDKLIPVVRILSRG